MNHEPILKSRSTRPLRPELHQLETFLKVVETRSFTAAARLIGCSQPAVSQTIARLEEVFGGDLFVRARGSRLALTPIGRAVEPYAVDLLATVETQMRRAIETAQSRQGQLTIGFFPGIASGHLRSSLRAFHAAYPQVHLQLVEGLPGDLHRQLSDRALDLMVAAFMPSEVASEIDRAELWSERLMVALPTGHPYAGRSSLTWAEVVRLRILLRTAHGEMSPYQALLARIGGLPIDCDQHVVSREALLAMVGIGLGATIIFESAAVPHPDVLLLPICDLGADPVVEAFWPANDANPLRHRLLSHLRAPAADRDPVSPASLATAPAPDPGSPAP